MRKLAFESGHRWQDCTLADVWPAVVSLAENRSSEDELKIAEGMVAAGLIRQV